MNFDSTEKLENQNICWTFTTRLISSFFQRFTYQISQNCEVLGNLTFHRPYMALGWAEKLEKQWITRIFRKSFDFSNLSEIDTLNLSKLWSFGKFNFSPPLYGSWLGWKTGKTMNYSNLSQINWFLQSFRDWRARSLKTIKIWEIYAFNALI